MSTTASTPVGVDVGDERAVLVVNGQEYDGWTELRVTRGLDRCASDFDLACAERWLGQDVDWQILPFVPVQVLLNGAPAMNGFCDVYEPGFGGREHAVRVTGRSLTQDLIDCSPDIASGQFKGYALGAIARALCAMFDIPLVIDPSAAAACQESVADATMERAETAFQFLERLCRLAAVLACDTPAGALLLTRTGTTRAAGSLVEGRNIFAARGKFDVKRRFSQYIVKGQAGVAGGAGGMAPDPYAGVVKVASTASYTAPPPAMGTGHVQTAQHAVAIDAGVPRFRPHVTIAESQLNLAQMQQRANWQRNYAYGRSIELTITVKGWLQPDGTLWALNQLVPVTSPRLGIDQDLLVVKTEARMGRDGTTTQLTVAPPEGYTPDPGEVKARKHRGKRGRKGHAVLDLTGVASVGN